ncbi:hypothetical protein FA95DRAFT_1502994 [Auriscalpium vulgare]|uniref:Uncharacterized protein n=1 Tax=Auriscalpium vulgare TaxID=40419 RepID=A0ACB8R8A0_9AGAM|nr:hypothetical protein FA95DRAFT_1502994 [Auriscalpium vulgare]
MLKKPITALLFLWIFALVLTRVFGIIEDTLSPLCSFPGISQLCPQHAQVSPVPIRDEGNELLWADYPRLMAVERIAFESLLEETSDGPGLAIEIKKAEIATRDLATLVRVSDLTRRDLLADTLDEFTRDARKVGRGLQKFSSRVNGAIDNVLAVNDYCLRAIEAAQSTSETWSLDTIRTFLVGDAVSQRVVTETFTNAMGTLSANMQRLILDAEASILDLTMLEQQLANLQDIVAREDSSLSSAQSELLANLWTRLGGNRKVLHGFAENRALLWNLGSYRTRALAHVVGALQTLMRMSEDMQDLRERVAAPELVGDRIPVDVHIKSIRTSLERLQERRIIAKEHRVDTMKRIGS